MAQFDRKGVEERERERDSTFNIGIMNGKEIMF